MTATGATLTALVGRRRAGAIAAAAALLTGSVMQRTAVYRAGRDSAAGPRYTVGPQRERRDARDRQAS